MIKSACYFMKRAATSSVSLIVIGGLLVLVSQLLSLNTAVPAIFSYLGFTVVLTGLLVMLVTLVTIMIPKVSRRLEQCQH